MGLDAHVVPISAFMVNDYEPAMVGMIKAMGMESVPAFRFGPDTVEQITPSRSLWGRFQLHTGIWSLRRKVKRWKASRRRADGLRYVEWLRSALKESLGVRLDWSEEGDSVLTHQVYRGSLQALRMYALRVEFPEALGKVKPYTDDKGEEIDLVQATYKRKTELKLKSDRFVHLFLPCDVHGFFLPPAFDPPQDLEDPSRSEARLDFLKRIPVGSSFRLLQELEELNERLVIRTKWDTRNVGLASESDDPELTGVHLGWKLMEGFARTSVETNLPICFDG